MPTIDQNTRNVGLGFVHGTQSMVLPLVVNPINNRLLIEIVPRVLSGTGVQRNLHIDGNTKNVGGGITDNPSEIITNLTVDEVVGFPCLRVQI